MQAAASFSLVEVSFVWAPAEHCAQRVVKITAEADILQLLGLIVDGKHCRLCAFRHLGLYQTLQIRGHCCSVWFLQWGKRAAQRAHLCIQHGHQVDVCQCSDSRRCCSACSLRHYWLPVQLTLPPEAYSCAPASCAAPMLLCGPSMPPAGATGFSELPEHTESFLTQQTLLTVKKACMCRISVQMEAVGVCHLLLGHHWSLLGAALSRSCCEMAVWISA